MSCLAKLSMAGNSDSSTPKLVAETEEKRATATEQMVLKSISVNDDGCIDSMQLGRVCFASVKFFVYIVA